ncbi:MAG TPA: CPBP family glutamic-type intramembrane protease, partial [Gaiellales bacterium]|nr:CPBP family glutamic-type intramembrane protease [Gaiellales bacterium]
VWAGAHLVPGVLVIFTCEGVLLAYLRSRTGSVLPGVALHTAQNTAASLLGGVGMLAVAPLCVTVALVLVAWLVLREPSPAAVPT